MLELTGVLFGPRGLPSAAPVASQPCVHQTDGADRDHGLWTRNSLSFWPATRSVFRMASTMHRPGGLAIAPSPTAERSNSLEGVVSVTKPEEALEDPEGADE